MPTTHHFGTDVNPSHFVETPDPANPGQVKRPPAGIVLKVRAAPTGLDLPDVVVVTQAYGYWEAAIVDVPEIFVSGPDESGNYWTSQIGPLTSAEASTAGVNAGANATAALAKATSSDQRAANAETDVASVRATVESIAANPPGGGVTSYLDLADLPTIPPKSELTVDVFHNGTAGAAGYVVPAGYKRRVFWGPPSADPGVKAADNDEWIKVT